MKTKLTLRTLALPALLFATLILQPSTSLAQTAAITYQGVLTVNGTPANSTNDFTFRLFGVVSGGSTLAGPITNLNVRVTNGLFTVIVDFGAIGDTFYASDRWLEIATRPAGSGAFVSLSPRQPITATPRALYAGYAGFAAGAATLTGPLPGASLAGNYSQTVSITNAANQFRGSFTGNGGGLTNLNAAQLASGTLPSARLSGSYGNALTLNNAANSFTGSGAGLAGLNASQLASGTVPDARLAANVARRDQGNTFTAAQTITNGGQVPLRLQGNDTGGTWLDLANASAGGRTWNFISSGSGNGEGAGKLLLRDSAQGVLMTLSTNGNVGIGTVNPAAKLEVAGTVKANAFAGNWEEVTGTAQQAVPNRGYLANHAAQVTITLPPAPAVGDVVRVTGVGAGGWKIAQNSGQGIRHWGIRDPGSVWIPRETNRDWWAVASSADGTKLVAVVDDGQIYTSSDSGVNWTPREADRNWRAVASSADGTKLVAVVGGGQIYTSTDSGVNWTPRGITTNWFGVAASSDGTKLVATVDGGQIYTSTDSGVNWTPRDSKREWRGVASSADGTKLIAVVGQFSAGWAYTSTDSGLSWTPRAQLGDNWRVASSADGNKLVVVGISSQTFTSTDSGVTWTPRGHIGSQGIASSADGSKLVASRGPGQIHTSRDSGVNWTPRESIRDWFDVASSADGSKLVAVVTGGQIYTSDANSSVGVNGGITGEQYAAVELQHLGGGVWRVLSHEDTITPF
jgi:hypothetical protein